MEEINISRAIIEKYTNKLLNCLQNDVIIVGAGPAGLTAGYYLAKYKIKTTIIEKRLSIGGGIWGGAAGKNIIALEENALPIVKEMDFRIDRHGNIYTLDAIEFASGKRCWECENWSWHVHPEPTEAG